MWQLEVSLSYERIVVRGGIQKNKNAQQKTKIMIRIGTGFARQFVNTVSVA